MALAATVAWARCCAAAAAAAGLMFCYAHKLVALGPMCVARVHFVPHGQHCFERMLEALSYCTHIPPSGWVMPLCAPLVYLDFMLIARTHSPPLARPGGGAPIHQRCKFAVMPAHHCLGTNCVTPRRYIQVGLARVLDEGGVKYNPVLISRLIFRPLSPVRSSTLLQHCRAPEAAGLLLDQEDKGAQCRQL